MARTYNMSLRRSFAIVGVLACCPSDAQDLFLASGPKPLVGSKVPCVQLKNAAKPGTCYPMTGLGLRGSGYEIGQPQQCWYYPKCCTKDYCPAINATRDWLKLGGSRIDTGYPFGDSGGHTSGSEPTCGGRAPPPSGGKPVL